MTNKMDDKAVNNEGLIGALTSHLLYFHNYNGIGQHTFVIILLQINSSYRITKWPLINHGMYSNPLHYISQKTDNIPMG